MAEFTRSGAVRTYFHDLCRTLWPQDIQPVTVQVALGMPGPGLLDDIISVGDTRMRQEPGPMGTRRVREETIEQFIVFSSWRAGGPETETTVTDRVYELLGTVENHVRKTDPTLGGLALHCFLTDAVLDTANLNDQQRSNGRHALVTATFTATTRIATT